jgi:hypothetical protein
MAGGDIPPERFAKWDDDDDVFGALHEKKPASKPSTTPSRPPKRGGARGGGAPQAGSAGAPPREGGQGGVPRPQRPPKSDKPAPNIVDTTVRWSDDDDAEFDTRQKNPLSLFLSICWHLSHFSHSSCFYHRPDFCGIQVEIRGRTPRHRCHTLPHPHITPIPPHPNSLALLPHLV